VVKNTCYMLEVNLKVDAAYVVYGAMATTCHQKKNPGGRGNGNGTSSSSTSCGNGSTLGNKKFNGVCHYCKKPGHHEKDSFKKKKMKLVERRLL
jgi:hypothetical protein